MISWEKESIVSIINKNIPSNRQPIIFSLNSGFNIVNNVNRSINAKGYEFLNRENELLKR
jgi:hypothetical protein